MNYKNELVCISKYAGMREDLVQAGGGNSSVKISKEEMLIKASGYSLSELTETEGYSVVNYSVITEFFKNTSPDKITKKTEEILLKQAYREGARPSIETFLHSITGTVTLHTHAVLAAVLASRKDGMMQLQKLFPEALLIPYATPGIALAAAYFCEYQKYQKSGKELEIVFLQNHGLLVSGNTALEVIEKTESVLQKIAEVLSIDYRNYSDSTMLYQKLAAFGWQEDFIYQVQNRNVEKAYLLLGKKLWELTVSPDTVVYCGRKILSVKEGEEQESIQQFFQQYGKPSVLQYRDQFYILASSMKKAKEIESLLAFSAEIAVANQGIEETYLTEQEQEFLLNWDAELYRKNKQ